MRSFILVFIHHHFKPCAFGRMKCHAQMLCNSVREGPDYNYHTSILGRQYILQRQVMRSNFEIYYCA